MQSNKCYKWILFESDCFIAKEVHGESQEMRQSLFDLEICSSRRSCLEALLDIEYSGMRPSAFLKTNESLTTIKSIENWSCSWL